MPRVGGQDLLFVSKAKKERLDALAAGASLVDRTGYSLPQIISKATLDRLAFARALLADADFAYQSSPPKYRAAVSRAYYSMYHSLRAVSFFCHGGDDHEQHMVLPTKLPSNFPNRRNWENALKGARYERNRADYDPYPRIDRQFELIAQRIVHEAKNLIPVARTYLKQNRCGT